MGQQEFSNISLILFVDEFSDQTTWESVRALAKIRCRTELLLVAKDHDSAVDLPKTISYRPIPKVFPCLGKAAAAAKHPLIGILDPGAKLDPSIVQHLCNRADQHPIQTAYFDRPSDTGKIENLFLWIFTLISRLLLGTWKSDKRPGFTILQKPLIL